MAQEPENPTGEPPPKMMSGMGWVAVFVAVAILFTFAYVQLQSSKKTQTALLPDLGRVPEFSFVNELSEPLGRDTLKGKVWVANFVFTRCPGPCPMMTSRMLELQQNLQKIEDGSVQLVTFTVDPEYDTPEVLAEYAKKAFADPARWNFATGEPAAMEEFVVKGMLQPLATEPDGSPAHSTRFVVVDEEGRMRAFRDGMDPEVVPKLLTDIGALMREKRNAAVEAARAQ